jgi:hypothetical protein
LSQFALETPAVELAVVNGLAGPARLATIAALTEGLGNVAVRLE